MPSTVSRGGWTCSTWLLGSNQRPISAVRDDSGDLRFVPSFGFVQRTMSGADETKTSLAWGQFPRALSSNSDFG
jgi:hypothetical protein